MTQHPHLTTFTIVQVVKQTYCQRHTLFQTEPSGNNVTYLNNLREVFHIRFFSLDQFVDNETEIQQPNHNYIYHQTLSKLDMNSVHRSQVLNMLFVTGFNAACFTRTNITQKPPDFRSTVQ